MNEIREGDIYDIGQTVSGQRHFVWKKEQWHYAVFTRGHLGTFIFKTGRTYEYSNRSMTKLVLENPFNEVKLVHRDER